MRPLSHNGRHRRGGGAIREETAEELVIVPPAGEAVTVRKSKIASRSETEASAMPPMGPILSKRELRDLMAYLITRD